jgi:hypothetical protein
MYNRRHQSLGIVWFLNSRLKQKSVYLQLGFFIQQVYKRTFIFAYSF